MEPPHNKPTTGRTSFVKGTCPPSADSGQVPKAKEYRLTKVLPVTGLPSLHELVQNEVKEGKLTCNLVVNSQSPIKSVR
jgi:hypothetical protein